ncbi:MAG: Bax inhibitor-1/YccA family protein [Bacteroidota bacterium]
MENQFYKTRQESVDQRERQIANANPFLTQVFGTMTIGLGISALTAWWVANSAFFDNLLYGGSIFRWIVMFAPLIFVFFFSSRVHKMSFSAVSTSFGVFSLLMGISLSFIFKVFSMDVITQTFLITAGTFGAMAIVGMFGNIDLSKWGNYLYMALIGLIITSIVNLFGNWSWLSFGISAAGVVIFSAFTAYDVQRLLRIGAEVDPESESSRKLAVMGALDLYLDFVNLFLYLLRFVGMGRD